MNKSNDTTYLRFRYNENDPQIKYEICLDEVGRGPLFGRLYTAAVVLKKDINDDINAGYKKIKDSKKFSSKKKMKDVNNFIKENAFVTSIQYIDVETIDEINILQSVFRSMHQCINDVLQQIEKRTNEPISKIRDESFIVVDGNLFQPYCYYDENQQILREIPHVTVEKGDGLYMGIAAASIIAKVAHDEYIYDLCIQYPELTTRYNIDKNVGYGTKRHIDGIVKHGITQFHRKTFGICKTSPLFPVISICKTNT